MHFLLIFIKLERYGFGFNLHVMSSLLSAVCLMCVWRSCQESAATALIWFFFSIPWFLCLSLSSSDAISIAHECI